MPSEPVTHHDDVLEALARDRELSDGLGPLLAGAHGECARALVLDLLHVRLAEGSSLRASTLGALADALRLAAIDRGELGGG